MSNRSLIFIPDISGFTNFVRQTDIRHSRHIISELLEVIIDSDELGMTVAEIEGDAVLFYLRERVPDPEQLYEQARKMFINFHSHLKRYDRDRICQCGACSSATRLTLKFIAHAGHFQLITIKEQKKPHGADLILAHRLLKNPVPEAEYILLSNAFADLDKYNFPKHLKSGKAEYEAMGTVEFRYLPLGHLYEHIPEPPALKAVQRGRAGLVIEGTINCPRDELYDILVDLEKRHLWNRGVDKFEFEADRVNRAGTRHVCLIGGKTLDFETIRQNLQEDDQVFGERTSDLPMIKTATTYYILREQGTSTRLRIEIHFVPRPLLGRLFLPLVKMKLNHNFRESFRNLKELCENRG